MRSPLPVVGELQPLLDASLIRLLALVVLDLYNKYHPGVLASCYHHASTEGPIMVPRGREATTTQTLRRSPEPAWVGRKECPKGRKESVAPLALRDRGTVISP